MTAGEAFYAARGQLTVNMINAGLGAPDGTDGKAYVENRMAVANDTVDQQIAAAESLDPAALVTIMQTVNADPATVAAAETMVTDLINFVAADTELTVGLDHLVGNDLDNVFIGTLAQNDLGSVVNTFESGDTIEGMGGRNELHVDLAATGAPSSIIGTTTGPTISAITNNVQEVYIHAQYPNVLDTTIDAERMTGVEEWWSDNSRSTISIEDIRSRPDDTTFGMTQTDPLPLLVGAPLFSTASFYAAFDPAQLDKNISSVDSSLTITMEDLANPAAELANIAIDGFVFTLDGVNFEVRSDAMANADTYVEFQVALDAALAAIPELAAITTVLNADNTITMTDPAGGAFVPVGVTFLGNIVPPAGTIAWDMVQGAPVVSELPIETNIVLDDVGRSSQGGEMVVGSMAEGGIDTFNVLVGRDSWVSGLASRSYVDPISTLIPLRTGIDNKLETVNVSHLDLGSTSSLTIGETTRDPTTGQETTVDGRVVTDGFLKASPLGALLGTNVGGLQDVRVFNAEGFAGELNVAAGLNRSAIGQYLDGLTPDDIAAGKNVFAYTMGSASDILSLNVALALSSDPDFMLNIDMGNGDDRLNLDLEFGHGRTTLEGGDGVDTLEVTEDSETYAGFNGFENLEVAGRNTTWQDMNDYPGITNVVIATRGWADTFIENLAADTQLTISGKAQTLGNNSNDDQIFGSIEIVNSTNPDLTIDLDNTGRIDAEMIIEAIDIWGTPTDADSDVRSLTLNSMGERETTNTIEELEGDLVNTFRFVGTQSVTVGMPAFGNGTVVWGGIIEAANTEPGGDPEDFTVDASGLIARVGDTSAPNIQIAVESYILTNVDADGQKNTLIGSGSDEDTLGLDGEIFTTNNTSIEGFETIIFDDVFGSFDVSNVEDVVDYVIYQQDGDFAMVDMVGDEKVEVVDRASTYELLFAAASASSSNVLDVSFDENVTFNNTDRLIAQDFYTIMLEMDDSQTANSIFGDLRDANGNSLYDGAALPKDIIARELIITGGKDGSNGSAGGWSTLDMIQVANVFKTVDFSDYVGQFTTEMYIYDAAISDDPMDPLQNPDIVAGKYGFNVTETDLGVDDTIVTYHFTEDAIVQTTAGTVDADDWVITGFDDFTSSSLTSISILDLSDLGITGFGELSISQVGANTLISAFGMDFEIALIGITSANLTNENFQFA